MATLTTLTWIGGGNNKASNPNDWSPTGVPQPSDTLQIVGPGTYAMNVQGNDLRGDPLGISDNTGTVVHATVNLSHNAAVTARVMPEANATFNLSGVSHLDLSLFGQGAENSATVNLASNSVWIGSFHVGHSGPLSISGGAHSVFINDGASGVDSDILGARVAVPVLGKGSIGVNGHASRLEFASSVGASQSVDVSGAPETSVLTIDHPHEYHASTSIGYGAEIDLVGLAHADSYTFKNDMLAIYSGNHVIYGMRLQDGYLPGVFAVAQTPSGVNIFSSADPNNLPAGALPIHHWSV